VLGHQAFFGEPAVHHLAHQALRAVKRIDEHAVTRFPARHGWTDFKNFAGEIEPDDHRHGHLDPRHSAHREHIVIVEGRCAHADHDMTFRDDRVGKVGHVLQLIQSAVLSQYDCFHASPPMWVLCGKAALPGAEPAIMRRRR
jgi:hypothetical protein